MQEQNTDINNDNNKQRHKTYGDESESDDVDRALIREDNPLIPPMPPSPTTTTRVKQDNTGNACDS